MPPIRYAYLIQVNYNNTSQVVAICSSLNQLKSTLLDVMLEMEDYYQYDPKNYKRLEFNKEYRKDFDQVKQELREFGYSSAQLYDNFYNPKQPDNHINVKFEITVTKHILNSHYISDFE